jgi:hypothetical protein
VPTSLQYPLERQRDVQRRWNRLLERTITPKEHSQVRQLPRAGTQLPMQLAEMAVSLKEVSNSEATHSQTRQPMEGTQLPMRQAGTI